MIKLEHTTVTGWDAAIRGMRNPMNSWEKSDTTYSADGTPTIGLNDHALMMRLAKAGTEHAKYRRMIAVYVDVTAPMYLWSQIDTYKVGTVANSCSKMHKIHEKEFTVDDFSNEQLIVTSPLEYTDAKTELIDVEGNDTGILISPRGLLDITIGCLNNYRQKYLETKDKRWWWQMIQLLPASYNQKRTLMLNYETLSAIYRQRRNHKLDEWHTFCAWIEELPYSEIITLKEDINID